MEAGNIEPAKELLDELNLLKELGKARFGEGNKKADFGSFPSFVLIRILNGEDCDEKNDLEYFLTAIKNNRINKLKEMGVEL